MIRDSIHRNNPIKSIKRDEVFKESGIGVIDIYFSYEEFKGNKIIKIITNCKSDLIVDFGNAIAKLNKNTINSSCGAISIWSSISEISSFQTKRFKTRDGISLCPTNFKLEDHLHVKPRICYRAIDFENYGKITRLKTTEFTCENKQTIPPDDLENNGDLLTAILYDRQNTLWKSFTRWSLNTSLRSIKWSRYSEKGYLTSRRSRVCEIPFDTYIRTKSKPYDVIDETKETITLKFDDCILNLRKRRQRFELMNKIEHVSEWKIYSDMILNGMEKNIISCLKNLYKLEEFPKNDKNFFLRNGRGFILLKKIGDNVYSEINTKIIRIIENLKMCDHYEKNLVGYFKRTKYPIKPYGRLYYMLVKNYRQLPSLTYSEAAQMSTNEIKKHFWCKIYHRNDKRNYKENHSKIIKNPCWNYTKFLSVNTYFFDQELILSLDKSRRHESTGEKSTISYIMTEQAIQTRDDFKYGQKYNMRKSDVKSARN